jgi:hypothetical protein
VSTVERARDDGCGRSRRHPRSSHHAHIGRDATAGRRNRNPGHAADHQRDDRPEQPRACSAHPPDRYPKHQTSTWRTRGRTFVPVIVTTPEHCPFVPTSQRQPPPVDRESHAAFHALGG